LATKKSWSFSRSKRASNNAWRKPKTDHKITLRWMIRQSGKRPITLAYGKPNPAQINYLNARVTLAAVSGKRGQG
jgi:hypothetical protein